MINRNLYKGSFDKNQMNNNWRCPRCNAGILHLKKEKVIEEVNADTLEWEKIDPDTFHWQVHSSFVYTTLLFCSNEECNEKVICSGRSFIEVYDSKQDSEGYVEDLYQTYYQPLFFYPTINIFNIPKDTPEEVEKNIKASFSLAFSNKAAAANHIRISLESILTAIGVKLYKDNTKKDTFTLGNRLKELPSKYQKIETYCDGIRWLGNSGSHDGEEITFDNLFDGYDMLTLVLEEIYDDRHLEIIKKAEEFIKNKGIKE